MSRAAERETPDPWEGKDKTLGMNPEEAAELRRLRKVQAAVEAQITWLGVESWLRKLPAPGQN